jgi:hypothetical protein
MGAWRAAVAVLAMAGVAEGASVARQCRQLCADEIRACVAAGGRRFACRRQAVRGCRHEGVAGCQAAQPGVRGRVSDTLIPPSALAASGSSPSTIDLGWQDANTRDRGCAIERSNDPAGGFATIATVPQGVQTYRDGGLAPGATRYYRVRALGRKGAASIPSNVAGATTFLATSTTVATTSTTVLTASTTTSTTLAVPFAIRGVYEKDSSPSGFDYIVATGFTVLDGNPYLDYLNTLPPGVKTWVWLGDYDNTTCTWEQSDDWIRSHLAPIAGHPAIAAYFLADEPHVWDCPGAPQDLRARHDLVKSLDPGPPTFAVIEPHSPGNPYAPYVGMVDVIGVERYPCSWKNGCVFSKIDDAVSLAEAAAVPHYWAVIQAHQDDWYRLPTADELHEEFRHWRLSRMEGYIVFAWEWAGTTLETHPELLDALRIENAR